VPVLQEMFTHRVAAVLRKPAGAAARRSGAETTMTVTAAR
jgi:hypothetical protein